MNYSKRILICPLDWGLGHATRCIPIIRLLLKKNAEVIIAADGRPLELLKHEFPQLQFVQFKGYNISYPESGSMIFKMMLSIPKILKGIKIEHRQLDKLISELKIDIVISDNRYGCWNKRIKSIFITHQLMIKSPFAETLLHKLIINYIKKYNECWVPDLEEENNLSYDLAHKYKLPPNIFFIGPLFRFENKDQDDKIAKAEYDVMAIISGPEPQRSVFEKIILEQFLVSGLKALVVLGKPERESVSMQNNNVTVIDHLNSEQMKDAVLNSHIILCRSGYSTIMDLAALNKKAIFIPTPGQTEQEYLAEVYLQKNIAFSQTQSKFDLTIALKEAEKYKGLNVLNKNDILQERINILC
jgi:uncharacterized protein (TIGR00661 family)